MIEQDHTHICFKNVSSIWLDKIIFINTLKLGSYKIKQDYTNIYFKYKIKQDYIYICFKNKGLVQWSKIIKL